jgi:hypothetical protein
VFPARGWARGYMLNRYNAQSLMPSVCVKLSTILLICISKKQAKT